VGEQIKGAGWRNEAQSVRKKINKINLYNYKRSLYQKPYFDLYYINKLAVLKQQKLIINIIRKHGELK